MMLSQSVMTDQERRLLLETWNATAMPFAQANVLPQLVQLRSLQQPDAIAVQGPHERLSYHELNTQANQLAHILRRKGVGPEVLVPVCLERSSLLIVAELAILKAGGAYVPLDPTYPQQRLATTLAEVQAPIILTQAHLGTLFAEALPLLVLDEAQLKDEWSHEPVDAPAIDVQVANLAYMIYTSGSTGRPKGVQIAHKGLLNLIAWYQRTFTITPNDRIAYLTGVGFDASVLDIWPALASGACLVLPDEENRFSASLLQTWLIEQHITICSSTTSVVEQLLHFSWPEHTSLRYVLVGGDRLGMYPAAHIPFTLVNNYGPTEGTVEATYARVPVREGSDIQESPALGRPIDNVEVYLLNELLQPVPIGENGELYLGGVGLARGYFQRPDLTAERFIPHPFSHIPGARLYKTGDICRYRANGEIDFQGRNDHQVKVRGFRIELGEIEHALVQHELVAQATVLAREEAGQEKRLVAYLVPHKDAQLNIGQLRQHLSERLPVYMVPSAFVVLASLPLTSNGKIDRQLLLTYEETTEAGTTAFVAPRTQLEEKIATIFAAVLHLERVSVEADFFDLGGHSLLVDQAITRVREATGQTIPLRSLFEAPTVAALASLIEQSGEAKQLLPSLVIRPIARDLPLPLSFSQERVWFMHKLDPSNASYHAQARLRLSGTLNVQALERSLCEMVRRHEIFRTTFVEVNGQPVQMVHAPWLSGLPLIDLRGLSIERQQELINQVSHTESKKLLHIDQLPLARWTLFALDENEYLLLHLEHHLIHDGWSFNVFLGELLTLYQAFAQQQPSPLPERTIQFADFAFCQREWMQGAVLEAQLGYWKKQLARANTLLELPTDHPRPATQTFRGAAPRVDLSAELYLALKEVSRQQGVTLFMTMLAAYYVLLYRYSGQSDICVGSGVANRRGQEIEALIGMIVNTITLRADLSGNPSFADLLQRVRTLLLDAYEHEDVPFDKVVEALALPRNLSYNPLFQAMFSFHDSRLPDLQLPELSIHIQEGISNGAAKFDLNVIAIPRLAHDQEPTNANEVGMTLIWEYNIDLFDATTIERMVGHYRQLLEELVLHPEQKIDDIPLLLPAEKQAILTEWAPASAHFEPASCLQHRFEEQVALYPQKVAVLSGEDRATYAQLNRRANQLAHRLQAAGVGIEDHVALCMERSLDLLVGILGILKAGAAYVPIDPTYPLDRQLYIVADCQASILVTQESLSSIFQQTSLTVVCVDQEELTHEPLTPVVSNVRPENTAYIIYTSGSTGQPKGVVVTHANVARLFKATQADFDFRPDDIWTCFHSFAFDFSVWEIWGALLFGGTLVMVPYWVSRSPEAFYNLLYTQKVTMLSQTPSAFNALMQVQEELGSEKVLNLRTVVFGGEALNLAALRPWFERNGDQQPRLINMYGITETTVHVTYQQLRMADLQQAQRSLIGRSIRDQEVYVLNEQMQLAPIGVPGEIFVGGAGNARGYLHKPDLTAQRFVPHPFSSVPGARLYRTGDRARYLADGSLEYLGRLDFQVKLRGFRIELGEIEAALLAHADVREVVVLLHEDQAGEKQLTAYLVTRSAQALAIDTLRQYLQGKLPAYMIPAFFVFLESLPLTTNGKVDRRALPAPQVQQTKLEELVQPRTTTEATLMSIWKTVVNVEAMGVHDNFFELGGHSLIAARIMSRIRDTFHVELSLRALFDAPTVASLAAIIDGALQEQAADEVVEVETSNELTQEEVDDLIGKLDQLSAGEIDVLLAQTLNESQVD
ncbi:non-ribosomal peptide synthetase [Dictyobacter kobayashii]|uniref:Carrier domain-containing protein n=1 Tax=Dictyobacter kobayashii TaxID=2014872 RepID=A0A402AVC2_9CHLR|nr:non-ribosomal peptide synthetase [Dictyobacter kobayashii]GCE23090.1 hypothetical protein KDK_68900 [Dictyobacter kobayashii]